MRKRRNVRGRGKEVIRDMKERMQGKRDKGRDEWEELHRKTDKGGNEGRGRRRRCRGQEARRVRRAETSTET